MSSGRHGPVDARPRSPHVRPLLVLVSSWRHGPVDACPRSPHVRPLLISSSSSSGRHGPVDARPRPRDVHPVRHRDLLDAQQLHEEPRRVSYGEEDAPVREQLPDEERGDARRTVTRDARRSVTRDAHIGTYIWVDTCLSLDSGILQLLFRYFFFFNYDYFYIVCIIIFILFVLLF